MQGKFIYLLREHFYDVLKNLHFCRRNKEAACGNIPSLLVYTLYLIMRIAYTVHVFAFFLSEELPADLGKQNIQRICEAGS